jgi:O-antigen biosynthesis protein
MAKSSSQSSQSNSDQIVAASSELIIENTDDQTSIPPKLGLVKARKEYLNATLGKNAELLSVVVQSYNRLEKTKHCIESILKYTANFDYELILASNGSTDGTLEYYQSIDHPRKKIIQVTKNVGSVVHVMKYVSGRYIAFVTNDTYVTKNWIENLLACLKSDDAIGMVVPVVSNGSNLQGANITFNTLDEMYEKAAAHNVSDPRKWHDRLRLAFQLAIFKREALDVAGVILDYGYYHDFVDDDITFRIRRAGYRTVLCKDTFVHHDHPRASMTPNEVENFNESIKSGRQDFSNKYYGIDAWNDVNNYEQTLMSMVDPKQIKETDTVEILGIDVLCGTPILELKNRLKENSIFNINLSAFSSDPKYWVDLRSISTGKVIIDRPEFLKEYFSDPIFDFVFLGKPINSYQDPIKLLRSMFDALKQGGQLLFKYRNTSDFFKFFRLFGVQAQLNNLPVDNDHFYEIDIDKLLVELHSIGFKDHQAIAENWPVDQKTVQVIQTAMNKAGLATNTGPALAKSLVKEYSIIIHK